MIAQVYFSITPHHLTTETIANVAADHIRINLYLNGISNITWGTSWACNFSLDVLSVINIDPINGISITSNNEKTFGVNNRGEAFFKGEIIQLAEVGGKETRVEISPSKGFALSMKQGDQWQKHIYITDSSGWSGAGILVTSKYDVNEDGIVDEQDVKIMKDYTLSKPSYPGIEWM